MVTRIKVIGFTDSHKSKPGVYGVAVVFFDTNKQKPSFALLKAHPGVSRISRLSVSSSEINESILSQEIDMKLGFSVLQDNITKFYKLVVNRTAVTDLVNQVHGEINRLINPDPPARKAEASGIKEKLRADGWQEI